ncbi:transposase [Agromyces sp. Soil535]|nr:transposase [Agromyces sp. Soil535]
MSRSRELSDAAWARIESLMPVASARGGRPFQDHRRVVEAIIWRYRVGSPWRDLPAEFGPWQTAWKRHRRFSEDGTWDKIHAELLRDADEGEGIDWQVSVDSTINRAHQHATNLPRSTGGSVELQESSRRAR